MYLDRKIYFLSFADTKYIRTLKRIEDEAKELNFFDEIYCLTDRNLDTEFIKKHGDFIRKSFRGYGYWIWKPYLVQKMFDMMNDGEILVYVDAGSRLNKNGINRLKEYIDIVVNSKSGSLGFQMNLQEKFYTKMDVFKELGVEREEIMNTGQVMATCFLLEKRENTKLMVDKWVNYSEVYHLIDDTPSKSNNVEGYIDHRHDQSLWSIIRKDLGSEFIGDETWFQPDWDKNTNYPFHAMRLKY